MSNLSVALADARSFLNDFLGGTNSTLWPDTALLPFVPYAHRQLQIELNLNGIPVIKDRTALITVAAGVTDLSATGSNQQPSNLVTPIAMKEKATGSDVTNYTPLQIVDFIPDNLQDGMLHYYCWENEKILFIGSTSIRDVYIKYRGSLTPPSASNQTIGFIFGEQYLGPRIAGLAAASVGANDSAGMLENLANTSIDKIVRMNIKTDQKLPARRIPFRRARRQSTIF